MNIPKNKQIGSCVNEYLTSFGFGYDVTTCHMSCNALFPQIKCLSNNRRYPHLNAWKNAWFWGSCCCGILMLCCTGQAGATPIPPIPGDMTGTQTTHHTYNNSLKLDLRFSEPWRALSSGVWCCVVWQKFTCVSEEHPTSTFVAVE